MEGKCLHEVSRMALDALKKSEEQLPITVSGRGREELFTLKSCLLLKGKQQSSFRLQLCKTNISLQ